MPKLGYLGKKYGQFLDRKGTSFHLIVGILCAMLVALLDEISPEDAISSFLYLLPISIVAWYSGRKVGLVIATLCGFLWSVHNTPFATSKIVAGWNAISILGIFWIVALLVSKVRGTLDHEMELSRTDPLTGVMNMRSFSEIVGYEIMRHNRQRSGFSLSYIDLDNFKQVNDRFGHSKGDELLVAIVDCLRSNLRKTDLIARAGGDEFVIFYPATDQATVQIVAEKVKAKLAELSRENQWPTTLSIGVVTCMEGSCSLDEVIFAADKLMYDVKGTGRDDVKYATFEGKAISW